MSRSRMKESDITDGFGTITFSSWDSFYDHINKEMTDYNTYIWRGQRCDNWKLESKFDREIIKLKKTSDTFLKEYLERFKFASRGRRGPNPSTITDENDWWALGQHYGLITPLLDWTISPYVASYFAFVGVGNPQTKYRTVFALHKPSVENIVHENSKSAKSKRDKTFKELGVNSDGVMGGLMSAIYEDQAAPEVEFIRPFSDDNPRLLNQGGLFTRLKKGNDIISWVMSNFNGESTRYTLMKFLIPNKDREQCLKSLNRMNINHLTLFPDLYGASIFCNLSVSINRY